MSRSPSPVKRNFHFMRHRSHMIVALNWVAVSALRACAVSGRVRAFSRRSRRPPVMPPRSRTSRSASAAAPAQPVARPNRRPTVVGLGDDVGAAELGRRVAESLRSLRKERQLSLDQLAMASGVSRAALSQIESARTNPTLSILWKVAVGLGIPFQSLLGPAEAGQSRLLRSGDIVPLRTADGRVESRLLSPSGAT